MLILASNSPRRKQLMTLAGWDFAVVPAQIDEAVLPGELPAAYVLRLARAKASAAREKMAVAQDGDLVVAADTAVVDAHTQADGKTRFTILGKPADAAQAEDMLRSLRGRMHQVYTAVAVSPVRADEQAPVKMVSEVSVSDVYMREYSDQELLVYIASGDPMDKAGAYAIQHPGFRPVERLEGCYANVMGLPLCSLARLLALFGVPAQSDIFQACQQAFGILCPITGQALDGTGIAPL
ncbi:MAG: Maf family protein [Chloroflexota bacterium]